MSENKEWYEQTRKKYSLPSYEELEQELEISDIESKQLTRHIVIKIAEKLEFFTGFLDHALQPDGSSIHSMQEAKFIDNHRKQMYAVYSKLMQMNRQTIELSLKRNEKEDADFIKSFFLDWKEIKNELLIFVKVMKDSWKVESDSSDDVGYVG